MVFLLLKGDLEAQPHSNQLQSSLKPSGMRKQELKPSRITPSVGPNVASEFIPLCEKSRFTLRVSVCMFFQLLALSTSPRSMCLSSLSVLHSCPHVCSLPPLPLGSLPQPTQLLQRHPSLPLQESGAGASTAPMSLLAGVKTISSANVDTQKCFQLFEKQEQAFPVPLKTCKILSIPLSSHFSIFPLLFPFFLSKSLILIIIDDSFSWVFDSILLLTKMGKYKSIQSHTPTCLSNIILLFKVSLKNLQLL